MLKCVQLLKIQIENWRDIVNLDKENVKKIRNLIAFAVLLYLGVQNYKIVFGMFSLAWGFCFPFILGAAIAFILNVPMKFVERHLFGRLLKKKNKYAEKFARPVSLVMSLLFVVTIIMVVVLIVVPELATTIVSVAKRIEESVPVLQNWAEETFQNPMILEWIDSIEFNPQKLIDSFVHVLKSGLDNILTSTVTLTMGIVSTAMNLFIGIIFSFYILLQKERLSSQVKKALYALLPKNVVTYTLHVCSLANKTFASFITGQCIEAVILGSMFFVTMTLFRFPYAMLVGVLIAFTALIPVFGGFIGCWIGFFLILMVSPVQAIVYLGLFLVLQQIEGNLIYPHVVGNSVGLPSIWVLAAVTLGGSLMGVVGMLVFIPLVSVIYALFREWVYKRLKEKKIKV